MLHIIGHKNPDTDAICSAIVAAEYFRLMGDEAIPYRLGELNPETKFVLRDIGIEPPAMITVLSEGAEIVLVDHNARGQSIDAPELYTLRGIIDHHSIENLSTSGPIQMRFEPFASTCSVLFSMFAEQELEMSDQVAKLILAGILSDSLALRSQTTTDEDREIVDYLAEELGITDIQAYAKAMFDAKSDLGALSTRNILELDYKEFTVGNKKFGYGVMETTNPDNAMRKKNDILSEMISLKTERDLDWIFFSVIDIFAERNTTFVLEGAEESAILHAFGTKTIDQCADLGKRLSRKKELEPILRKYFETLI